MLVSGGPPIGSADQCDQNSQKLKFHSLNQSVIELDMQLEKFAQLQALQLNSCSNVPEEDAAAISHLIDEYSTQVSSFDERIKSIISVGLMKRKNTADILAAFEGLVHGKIDEDKMVIDTPCAPENCTPQRINSISNLKNVTPTIEQQQNGINFDDYPNTPTLEDLGLSRATLSLVGDRGFTKSKFKSFPL